MEYNEIFSKYREYRDLLLDFRERVKSNRLWYRQQQTEYQGAQSDRAPGEPSSHSGHIFNGIQYKHADMMDSYPRANVLPREMGDEESAKVLTDVLPYVLDRCGFKKTYSRTLYDKLIDGTSSYGVFWDETAGDGKGDIAIKRIDLLNFTWQPDAPELEESCCVFYDTFLPKADFLVMFGDEFPNVAVQAQYEDQKEKQPLDISETVVVTDCYFKERVKDGRKLLHFVKFSGSEVLYDSREKFPDGYYRHGRYPFVIDILHPVPGELYGFGMVDVGKDLQAHIDRLDWAINRNAYLLAKNRHFIQQNTGVNEEEFCDVSVDLVHVNGTLDEYHTRRIDMGVMPDFVIEHRSHKIEELKEILGNRDFAQGGTTGGVTSGTAITALQAETDGLVRDNVATTYMAFSDIVRLVIELIREFYNEDRVFRIVGDSGEAEYRSVSSGSIFTCGDNSIFDITVSVEKNAPYQRGLHNQLMMELMQAGLLNPQNFPVASLVLKNLNFDGKEKILQDLQKAYEDMQASRRATPQPPEATAPLEVNRSAGTREAALGRTQGSLEGARAEGGADPFVEIPIGDSGAAEVESFGAGGADPFVEIPLE